MKLKTFYSNQKIDDYFVLNEQELAHSLKVYRLNMGDQVNIICDDENIYTCVLENKNNEICAKIISFQKNLANPKTNLTVFQCNLKADKIEYLVQKLTELGVKELFCVDSEFIVKTNLRQDRLEKISKEASKQCGRSVGIQISPIISFKEMIKKVKEFDNFFVAYEREENVSLNSVMSNITGQNCAILIGCEGGIIENEIEQLKQNGAKTFGLGSRILRAETACVAISTIILNKLGEFDL